MVVFYTLYTPITDCIVNSKQYSVLKNNTQLCAIKNADLGRS